MENEIRCAYNLYGVARAWVLVQPIMSIFVINYEYYSVIWSGRAVFFLFLKIRVESDLIFHKEIGLSVIANLIELGSSCVGCSEKARLAYLY